MFAISISLTTKIVGKIINFDKRLLKNLNMKNENPKYKEQ